MIRGAVLLRRTVRPVRAGRAPARTLRSGSRPPRAPRPDPELARALAPVARRVRARHWLEAGRAGLTWALAWACAVLLVARFLPLPPGAWIAAGAAVALAAWAVLGWRGRPGAGAFAAAADGLGLQERAVTALELGCRPDAGGAGLAALVRADALARLAALDVRRYPLVVRRRAWGHVALLAGMAAVLAWLPNPMADVAARRAEERAAVRRAGAEVARLERLAAAEASRSGDRRWREAQEILRRLERELDGAREEALRALAASKEEAARLATPEERAAGPALSALGRAWRQGALGEAGRALQEGAGAARALPELSEALRRAASAAAGGEGQALAEALAAAGGAMAQAGGMADAAARLEGLLAELDRIAAMAAGQGGAFATAGGGAAGGAVSPARLGLASGQAGGAGGEPGSGGSGAGARGATGAGPGGGGSGGAGQGGGTGTPGAGSGAGSGTGTGAGAGGGRPGGGGGGMGPGPAGTMASSVAAGGFEPIFDPRLIGGRGDPSAVGGNATGASGEEVAAPWSPVGTGALRPYRDVFPRYEAEARESMTRIGLPPGLRELVRSYFSSLAPAETGEGRTAP